MSDSAEESDDAVTKAIERRRRAIEAEWSELGAVVLIGAGDPMPIPGRANRVYPFLAHSEASVFATQVGICLDAHAPRRRRVAANTATPSSGTASTDCAASAAFASRTTS